jgi:hypothetical protein
MEERRGRKRKEETKKEKRKEGRNKRKTMKKAKTEEVFQWSHHPYEWRDTDSAKPPCKLPTYNYKRSRHPRTVCIDDGRVKVNN